MAKTAYSATEKTAIYRVIRERRDVRSGFLPDAIPNDVLTNVLAAAHSAPSIGGSQPWDFVLIRKPATKAAVADLVRAKQDAYAATLPGSRSSDFEALRIDAITSTPVNIAITCDVTRGGWYTFGAPDEASGLARSVDYAIATLWLAARAEGLGVCLIGAYDEHAIAELLGIPSHLRILAYACLGYLEEFPPAPELVLTGWARKRPLQWAVHSEGWGNRGLPGQPAGALAAATRAAIPTEKPAGGDPAVVLALRAGDVSASEHEALLATSAAAGAETCVVLLSEQQDSWRGPGWLPRPLATDRLGADTATERAIETGIEIARDFYAGGNNTLLVQSGADPAEAATLAGIRLGAAALGMAVIIGGDAAASDAVVAELPPALAVAADIAAAIAIFRSGGVT